jgi:hypothetical protein
MDIATAVSVLTLINAPEEAAMVVLAGLALYWGIKKAVKMFQ